VSELARMAWPEVTVDRRVLVVPLGATEQHGPHLPLGTDTELAVAIASRIADRNPAVVVAPALPYGSSGEHQAFAGTLSIGQPALEAVLIELVRSVASTFSRVLLLNAHGGHARPVDRAVQRLRAEGHDVAGWSPAEVWAGDAHAGHVETSLMLALAPEGVRRDRVVVGNTTPLIALLPALVRSGVRSVSPNGVLGDPCDASAQDGRVLLEAAVFELMAFLDSWPTDDPCLP
jgi:mycofactocin precursor peptide peptidase